MMNEYPQAFTKACHEVREGGKTGIVAFNATEYLELIEAAGVKIEDYPICQAVNQHKIWKIVDHKNATSEEVEKAIKELKQTDHKFHVDGASWTNNLSWVKGYDNVLEPMNQLSFTFHQKFDPLLQEDLSTTKQPDYHQALLYNLLLQTSCFRYWGQGSWTDFAHTIYERGLKILMS